jgi:cobalamin biosynthesis protein CobT
MLQKALPIVAQAIGRKFGVQVVIGGQHAYTDGETIHLPSLPAEDGTASLLAKGYIDHEAAHVRYTNMTVYLAFARQSKIHRGLLNTLEDIRIEKAIATIYPGSKTNLRTLWEQIVADGTVQEPGEVPEHGLPVMWLLYQGRLHVLGQEVFREYARQIDQRFRQSAGDQLVDDLGVFLSGVRTLESTQEAVDLAQRVIDRLQQEADPKENSGGDADVSGSDRNTGNGDSQDAAMQSNAGDSQPGNNDSLDSAPSTTDDADAETNPGREIARQALDSDQDLGNADLGGLLSDRLEDISSDTPPDQRIQIDGWDTPSWDRRGSISRSDVAAETRALRTRLQGLIDARRRDRPVPKSRGRRVDPGRVHRLRTGNPKVFSRSVEREAPNTAVHVLMDTSGSMWMEQRSVPAARASLAIADALTGIPGVTSAVTAFPGPDQDRSVASIKDYDELVQSCAASWLCRWSGNTPTASALWTIAPGLLARQESRRIVIVVTDGKPRVQGEINSVERTQKVVNRMTQAGIEVLGLGIGKMEVEQLFPVWEVIERPDELAGAMFRILEERLVATA